MTRIDADWLDWLVTVVGLLVLTAMVFAGGYDLFAKPAEFEKLSGGSILLAAVWAVFLFVPDLPFRLIGACLCLGFMMRAVAQFLIATPEAMKIAAISSSSLKLLAYLGLLVLLIRDARQRVQIVQVDHNA